MPTEAEIAAAAGDLAARALAATIGELATRAQYETLAAGRGVVQESAPRWRRVTDGNPCGFCAMLASRGPVYRSAGKAGQGKRYHGRCGCTAEPFDGDPDDWQPTPEEQRYIDAYEAVHENGMTGEETARLIDAWLAGNPPAPAVVKKVINWASAKTPKDVGDLLQEFLGGRSVVSGFEAHTLDIEKVRGAAEQIAELFERYPLVNANVSIIPIKNSRVYAQATAYRDGYLGALKNLDLQLSQAKMGKRSKVAESFRKDVQSGHFHTTDADPVKYFVSHEFGHLVDFAGRGGQAGDAAGRIRRLTGAQRAMAPEDVPYEKWRKANISGYGQSNIDEQIAESFADVILNGDGAKPLSHRIHDEVVAMLEERRDG